MNENLLKGIDFSVEKRKMFFALSADETQKKVTEVKNVFANVRTDNNQVMGVVKGRYKIVDHKENLGLIDQILAKSNYKYKVAHKLERGRIYSRFLLDHTFTPPKGTKVEASQIMLNAINSYDATRCFVMNFGVYRQVCKNGQWGFANMISISRLHTTNLDVNEIMIKDVKKAIEECEEKYSSFYAGLIKQKMMTQEELLEKEILPEKLVKLAYQNLDGDSAWDLYNAFTGVITHDEKVRQERKRKMYKKVGEYFTQAVLKLPSARTLNV